MRNTQLSPVLAGSQPNFFMKSNYVHLRASRGRVVTCTSEKRFAEISSAAPAPGSGLRGQSAGTEASLSTWASASPACSGGQETAARWWLHS